MQQLLDAKNAMANLDKKQHGKTIPKYAKVEELKEKERNAGFLITWSEGQIMLGM